MDSRAYDTQPGEPKPVGLMQSTLYQIEKSLDEMTRLIDGLEAGTRMIEDRPVSLHAGAEGGPNARPPRVATSLARISVDIDQQLVRLRDLAGVYS